MLQDSMGVEETFLQMRHLDPDHFSNYESSIQQMRAELDHCRTASMSKGFLNERSKISGTLFFSYKNHVYKNVEAQICQNIRTS